MEQAPLMVGVSGLRGIVGKSLTPEVAATFARAFAAWLRRRSPRPAVVVGRDGRAGGEELMATVVETLMAHGCDVHEVHVCATPTIGVATDCLNAVGAVIVTASHNPQQWNGLKVLVEDEGGARPGASAPRAAVAAEIIDLFRSAISPPPGDIGDACDSRASAFGTHGGLLLRGVKGLGVRAGNLRFKAALDSVNASGATIAEGFLDAMGCPVVQLAGDRSGLFPHPPEPTRENLVSLCEAVREHKADIGFAQDPDADRLAIVDERGEYIGEEYTLALAAESLLSGGGAEPGRHAPAHSGEAGGRGSAHSGTAGADGSGPVLVANLSTSRMIDDIAARHGARVVRTAVGEANVVEAMKREKAAGRRVVLGGEGNGGVIWPEVTYVRDSLSAMALVLALMARTGRSVSELVAGLPRYAIEKRKVDLARKEDAGPAVEKLRAFYGGGAGGSQRIDLQDGIRVDFVEGARAGKAWLHVRASNTEPIMRLIAEAPSAGEARGILQEAGRAIGR